MTLSRDELAARFAVVAYGAPDVGEITQDDLAKHAVTMADALLAALASKNAATGAPEALEPDVPEGSTIAQLAAEQRASMGLTASMGATQHFKHDATPAPEAKRPEWVTYEAVPGCRSNPYAVLRWDENGSPVVGPPDRSWALREWEPCAAPVEAAPTESKGKVAREWTNADPSRSPVVTPTTKSPEDGENQRGEENSDPPPLDPDTHPLREEALAAWEKKYVRQAILSNTRPSHFKKFLQGYIAGHADARASGRLTPTPAPVAPPAGKYEPKFKDGTQYPSEGERVVVHELKTTDGFLIHEKHLSCRRVGAVGTATSYVPGHGGDVWFVRHDGDGSVAAYAYDELRPAAAGLAVPPPAPTPAPEAKRPEWVKYVGFQSRDAKIARKVIRWDADRPTVETVGICGGGELSIPAGEWEPCAAPSPATDAPVDPVREAERAVVEAAEALQAADDAYAELYATVKDDDDAHNEARPRLDQLHAARLNRRFDLTAAVRALRTSRPVRP